MDYKYLKELEGTLKEIIDSPEVPDKIFYQALKDLIDLKQNVEEFNHKFDQIGNVMTAMAKGEFNSRVDIPLSRNLFSFIGTAVNSVAEELEKNVTKISFLETLLELQPQPAIITNKQGTILFANKHAYAVTNYPPGYLSKLKISNLFASKLRFGNSGINDEIRKERVFISMYNKPELFNTSLTIQKIMSKGNALDGYLYLFG